MRITLVDQNVNTYPFRTGRPLDATHCQTYTFCNPVCLSGGLLCHEYVDEVVRGQRPLPKIQPRGQFPRICKELDMW